MIFIQAHAEAAPRNPHYFITHAHIHIRPISFFFFFFLHLIHSFIHKKRHRQLLQFVIIIIIIIAVSMYAREHTCKKSTVRHTPYVVVHTSYVCVPFIFNFTCSWLSICVPHIRSSRNKAPTHTHTHTISHAYGATCARRLCVLHPIHIHWAAELGISIDIVLLLFRLTSVFFFFLFLAQIFFLVFIFIRD